jgi:branched-chain amino acid transport system substrate-binding protein
LLSPQTGPIAVYAPGFEDAANLAVKHLNESQKYYTFELIVADSGCDGTQAATSAQSLVDSGVVGIAGAACSGATLGAIAVAAPAQVLMISYASTSPAITTAKDDNYLYRVVPSDAQQAIALAKIVSIKSSNPAIIYMTNDYGAGLGENFKAAWGGLCAEVGYDPTEGSYDASTLAQAVVDGGCDSVVLMSYATDGAAIMEELLAQGFSGALYGADGLADAAFVESFTDVEALDGLIATKPRPGEASTAKSDFESAYAAAGGNAEGIYTHETYDAVKLIGLAKTVAEPDSTKVLGGVGGNLRKPLLGLANPNVGGYLGAAGYHMFDTNGDVSGTGYEVCNFSGTSFSCPQIWTSAGGIKDK